MSDSKLNEQQQEQVSQEQSTQPAEQLNYKELYVRLNADLQNFKRRIDKERADWTETAQGIILSALLPIFEDFDRAIENTSQPAKETSATPTPEYLEGLILIQKNIKKTLEDLGVNDIDTSGQFNPEYHEALTQVDMPNHASGSIVQVFSKGYMFKGKVLKHAQVSVAK